MAARHNPANPFLFLLVFVVLSQIVNANINYGHVLYSGEIMYKSDTLMYGNYTLKLQTDCRLVLSDTGKQIWASSNRAFDQRCRCVFTGNGNLVIFHGGVLGDELWKAIENNRNPAGHYVLVLQKDRNLVIYGPVLWQTGTKAVNQMHASNLVAASSNERYVLYDGEKLNPGESLKNGRFSLVMQEDCDLVLYDGETRLWSTETAHTDNNCMCKLKSDGNLIVYKTWDVRPYWSAMKGRSWQNEGHYVLVLGRDGSLVLYDKPIWSTGTYIVKAMPAIHNNGTINEFLILHRVNIGIIW